VLIRRRLASFFALVAIAQFSLGATTVACVAHDRSSPASVDPNAPVMNPGVMASNHEHHQPPCEHPIGQNCSTMVGCTQSLTVAESVSAPMLTCLELPNPAVAVAPTAPLLIPEPPPPRI
jgi:hypothetical protein